MERGEQDPGEKLRREAFERSDGQGGIITRRLISEKVKNPSERETREVLELIASEVLNPVLQHRISVDILKKFKEIASKKYGYPLSAPFLSSSVIYDFAMSLNSYATQDFKNRSLLSSISIESICAYDISLGIMLVVSTIEDAENAIRGTFDNRLGNLVFDRLAGVTSLSEQTDFFSAGKAQVLKYSKLLREDPTGKSLIRRAVEEIEHPKREIYPNLREFVVHGARFAESAYEIVYPLAEKVSKPT